MKSIGFKGDRTQHYPGKLNRSKEIMSPASQREDLERSGSGSPILKLTRPNFSAENLFVETKNTSKRLLNLRVVDINQPTNSVIHLTAEEKKFQNDKESPSYLVSYEKSEAFLDLHFFMMVEPEAETKLRKHVKVLPQSQSFSTQQQIDSPLYCGSPSLQEISGSSLLARRANSRMQSPLLINPCTTEDSSNRSKSLNSMATPQKISRFASILREDCEANVIEKKEKARDQFSFVSEELEKHEIGINYAFKSPDKKRFVAIQEGSNENTPINNAVTSVLFPPAIFKVNIENEKTE